jgi:undecaprenyl pyrophosphate phosphatase UppP
MFNFFEFPTDAIDEKEENNFITQILIQCTRIPPGFVRTGPSFLMSNSTFLTTLYSSYVKFNFISAIPCMAAASFEST